jgi:hypothetical protein
VGARPLRLPEPRLSVVVVGCPLGRVCVNHRLARDETLRLSFSVGVGRFRDGGFRSRREPRSAEWHAALGCGSRCRRRGHVSGGLAQNPTERSTNLGGQEAGLCDPRKLKAAVEQHDSARLSLFAWLGQAPGGIVRSPSSEGAEYLLPLARSLRRPFAWLLSPSRATYHGVIEPGGSRRRPPAGLLR